MSTNPFVSVAHKMKDSISGAMQGLSMNHHSNSAPSPPSSPSMSSTNEDNDNMRHLSLDTSNIAKVLVIGETGSGKSTFINYLTNYFRSGSLQNIKVAIPSKYRPIITEQFSHCENNIRDTTQSKTDMCNQYIFIDQKCSTPKQYLFLDTPGLSDTRGAEQDNINMTKIVDAVESLGGLSAVIIVVNGTTGRLTLNLRNVIARLRGNLPDVVMDNVIVVMTNAKRHEANFNISSLQLHGTVYPYYMQNSAFSQDPSTWDQTALDALQYDWDASMDELKRMVETIDTFKLKSVTAFKDMKDIRNAIKALMHEARLEVSQIQKMQDELAAFEHALKQYKSDEVTYKDYTRERVVETKELVDTKYHSTVCRKCDHVCHDKCGLHETTTHGNRIFQRCWAMSPEGQCYICPAHCLYTEHYHARKTMKIKQQKLQDVLHDIKAKYDLATQNKSDFQTRITTTQEAKNMLERALKQKLDEIKQKCGELRRICSGFNLAQELHALIDQLKAEATMLRNIEAKQQAEEFIRSLSEFCRHLEADQNAKQILPPMKLVDTYTSKPLRNSKGLNMTNDLPSPLSPPPVQADTKPNLNTSVLDLITRLNKPKKQLPPVSSDDNDDDDSTDSDADYEGEGSRDRSSHSNRSHNRHPNPITNEGSFDEETSSNYERRKRRQSGFNQNNNNQNSLAQQYASFTTADLVQKYTDCKDAKKSNTILIELNRRSQGKSTGPLVSPTDIATFARYTQLYSTQDAPTLSHLYLQLQQRISNMTEPDILNIARVPTDHLLEIAALYTLIAQKNQQQGQNRDSNMPSEGSFERPPDHIANLLPTAPQTPNGFCPGSSATATTNNSHHSNGTATIIGPPISQTLFQPIDSGLLNTTLNSSIKQSSTTVGGTTVINPTLSIPMTNPSNETGSGLVPASSNIPNNTSTTTNGFPHSSSLSIPSQFSNTVSSNPFSISSTSTTASTISSSAITSSTAATSTSLPFTSTATMNIISDRSTNGSPFTFVSTPSSSNGNDSSFSFVNPVLTSSPGKDDYTMIHMTPVSNTTTDEDSSNLNSLATASITRLLTMYNEAKISNKNAQLFGIYQELERRCTGANNEQLIRECPAIYESKINEYASRSLSELKQIYANIQQHLQARMNHDATHINEVPKEYLIESAALLVTIRRKEL